MLWVLGLCYSQHPAATCNTLDFRIADNRKCYILLIFCFVIHCSLVLKHFSHIGPYLAPIKVNSGVAHAPDFIASLGIIDIFSQTPASGVMGLHANFNFHWGKKKVSALKVVEKSLEM